MNEFKVKEKNNDNKGLFFSIVGVLTLIVAIAGATYAFFEISKDASGITGTAATADITLNVTKHTTTATGDLIPQKGAGINTAANSGCLDGVNTVCQVYKVYVKNDGSSQVVLNGNISFGGITNMPNLKYATSSSATSGFSTTGTAASTSATTLQSNLTLAPNDESTIYLVVWINDPGSAQTDSGTFTATVNYNASNGQGVTSTITS